MKTTTKDYAATLRALPERQRGFYETLRAQADKVLRQFLTCFHEDLHESLIDIDLIYDYAMDMTGADFCRYDRMVIDFLSRDADFPKYVDIKLHGKSLSIQGAATQTFLDCATNSPKGRHASGAWYFLTHYFRWAMASKRGDLSLDLLLERHTPRTWTHGALITGSPPSTTTSAETGTWRRSAGQSRGSCLAPAGMASNGR